MPAAPASVPKTVIAYGILRSNSPPPSPRRAPAPRSATYMCDASIIALQGPSCSQGQLTTIYSAINATTAQDASIECIATNVLIAPFARAVNYCTTSLCNKPPSSGAAARVSCAVLCMCCVSCWVESSLLPPPPRFWCLFVGVV